MMFKGKKVVETAAAAQVPTLTRQVASVGVTQ